MYTYWLGGLIRWDQSGDNHLYLIQQVEGVNEEDVKGLTTHKAIINIAKGTMDLRVEFSLPE